MPGKASKPRMPSLKGMKKPSALFAAIGKAKAAIKKPVKKAKKK